MITAAEANKALDNPDTVVECYDGVNQHVVRRGRLVGYSQCPTVVIKTDSHPFSWVAHLARIVPRDTRDDFEVIEEGEPLHAAYAEVERLRTELDDAWAVLGPDGMSLAGRIRSLQLERDSWQKLAEKLAPMQTIEPDADQQLREARNANHVTDPTPAGYWYRQFFEANDGYIQMRDERDSAIRERDEAMTARDQARTELRVATGQPGPRPGPAPGSCGLQAPGLGPVTPGFPACRLAAGHEGWHHADDGCEWGEVKTDDELDPRSGGPEVTDEEYMAHAKALNRRFNAGEINMEQWGAELEKISPIGREADSDPYPNAPWHWPADLIEAVGPKIRDAINSAWDDQYVAEQAAPVFKRWNPDRRPSPEAVRLAAELIPDDGPKHATPRPTADVEGTYPFAPDYTAADLDDDGRAVLLHNCPPEHALVCGHTHLDDGTSRMCTEPVNGLQCPVHGQRTAPADPKRHRFELHYPTHHDLHLIAVLGED